MTFKLRDFVAMQRARGMSDEAIRRALGLSRAQVAEAGLLGREDDAAAAPGSVDRDEGDGEEKSGWARG